MICRSNNYIYIYIENHYRLLKYAYIAIPHIVMSNVDAAQIKRD